MRPEDEDILAEYAQRLESGEDLSPEAFLAENPGLDAGALPGLHRLAATRALFPSEPLAVPREIGGYRIVRPLGQGGAGIVFEAQRLVPPPASVALKVLTFAGSLNPRVVERFRREGEILSRIRHPGVVRVHEVGVDQGTAYIAMDRVEGRTLAEVLASGRPGDRGGRPAPDAVLDLPGEGERLQKACRFVLALARAVAELHASGIVHRDLKPANVLVDAAGQPVLIDFGLAGDEQASTFTASGEIVGTPQYMAPEQARGEETTPRTDVYALGAILHEMLALEPLHAGRNPHEVLARVRAGARPPLRSIAPRVPKPLALIVECCLGLRSGERYPDAKALAADLEAWLDGRPIAARPAPWPTRWRRGLARRPRLAAAAVLAGLLSLSWIVLPRAAEDPPPAEVLDRDLAAASVAWLDGDEPTLAQTLARLRPSAARDPILAFLDGAQRGALPETSSDASVRELIAGERKRRAGDVEGALSHLRTAVLASPELGLAHALYGIAAKDAAKIDLAERELTIASWRLPGSRRIAEARAQVLARQRKFRDAARDYEAALVSDPDNANLWYELAKAHYYAGDAGAGLRAAAKALERLGNAGTGVLELYGVLLDGNGRHDEARKVYRDILLRQPRRSQTLYNLAFSYDTEHLMADAERTYRAALEAEPANAVAAAALANLYSGASRDICERCQDFFGQHPAYLDPLKAEDAALQAVQADKGRNPRLLDLAVTVAHRIERTDRLRAALASLLEASESARPGSKTARRGEALRKALAELDRGPAR